VAILLAGGVLLGFLALVIDVGRVYVEREELRGGADAAALGVAKACADATVDCSSASAVLAVAQRFADGNASDQLTQVVAVCCRFADREEPCPQPAGNLTDCLGQAPGALFVEVHLATEVGGGYVLPPMFAGTLTGNPQGAAVAACARATWTPATQVSIVALALSECEFAAATATGFVDPVDATPADEESIELVPGHGTCPGVPPSPWLRPGPAAWLAGDAACQVTPGPDGQLVGAMDAGTPSAGVATGGVPSAGVPSGGTPNIGAADPLPATGCVSRLAQARVAGEIVFVAVYDGVSAARPERTYHLSGLAPFLVTGWRLGADPAAVADSSLGGVTHAVCGAGDPIPVSPPIASPQCVAGVFVGPWVALSELASGTAIVSLIG
jgi:hypothetical protein